MSKIFLLILLPFSCKKDSMIQWFKCLFSADSKGILAFSFFKSLQLQGISLESLAR